ncbi:hypothetical protein ACFQ51_40675 [Streptomyces kaempferi]
MGAETIRCVGAVRRLLGALDPACQIEFGRRLGASLPATAVIEMDCNHWTVLQRPAEVAQILEKHWSAHADA